MPRPAKGRDQVFSIWTLRQRWAAGLRLGNRSLHSTSQAGAQNSQSPEEAEEGGDGTSMLFGVRPHRSILLTFKKLMIGKIGRPCRFMGWSGRAPAPPAISWPGAPRQGARHGDEAPEIVIQPSERPQRPQSGK